MLCLHVLLVMFQFFYQGVYHRENSHFGRLSESLEKNESIRNGEDLCVGGTSTKGRLSIAALDFNRGNMGAYYKCIVCTPLYQWLDPY